MSNMTDPSAMGDMNEYSEEEDPDRMITIFSILTSCLCLFLCAASIVVQIALRPNVQLLAELQEIPGVQEGDRRREWISQNLVVTEWANNPESKLEEDEPSPTWSSGASSSGETDEELAIQEPTTAVYVPSCEPKTGPACAMGGDGDDETASSDDMPGCAICLGAFKDRQLVCASSSASCPHTFHEPCMYSWLLKHDECPMCRQPYLIKDVSI